jgi:diguanylate cyclase (GGDEF)-like protein
MGGTLTVLVATLAACVTWLCAALDRDAQARSTDLMTSAAVVLLRQVQATTLDYAKWATAVAAVEDGDVGWIFDNVGLAAKTSVGIQLAIVRGGPLEAELGWTDDELEAPRTGIIPPGDQAWIDQQMSGVPVGAPQAVTHFLRVDGRVFAASTARVEPAVEPDPSRPAGEIATITMGLLVDDAVITDMAERTQLSGLRLSPARPSDGLVTPLPGTYDVPSAYLVWTAPKPGTALLRRIVGPLALVVLLATGLSLAGIVLARRNAQGLVEAERRSSVAARTDALTGLPNRAAFNEVLGSPARAGERAILFLDVNDFKRINDSIGHEAGDQVIVRGAQRLAELAGQDCVLARIAGDEFVFVVTGAEAEARTRELAAAVRRVLADPFRILGHQMQIGMAMGYAVQATDDMSGLDLVRQADLAMYEAKRRKGRHEPVAFSAVIEQASQDALVIEQGLRRALARPGELFVAYQPIVGADARIERAEALARWRSPDLGLVPPDRFIAVAEQAGLIVELGRQLLCLVCDDLAAHPDLEVSVNISPLQLMSPNFIPRLVSEVASRGIDPRRVEIELTEAVVVDDSRLAAQRLEELRAAGFSIALDDFGTGYSSVGYLEQFRFSTLKIDRSFVSRIRGSAQGVAVVDGIIRMAHGLGLRVVCEGVETAEELALLRELGCDLLQGYHLDPPLPIWALADRWLGRAPLRAAVA